MSQSMPITPSIRLSGPYTVGAGQVAFSVTFPFQRDADLLVQVRPAAGDAWTAAVLGADYAVAGAGAASGGVTTFGATRPTGSQVRIVGLSSISSEVDAVPAGGFDSSTFNWLVDRLTIWAQEARRDIDDLLSRTATGSVGWCPVHAIVVDGARRVMRLVDWVGGTGVKPATGTYLGPSGLVVDIAEATDIRGAQGVQGAQGPVGAQGVQGPEGPTGPAGTGVRILGSVANVGALPGSATVGDAYLITGDLYVWTGSAWQNAGSIQGPAGPAGPGVPTGGAADQVLMKLSGTNYDTEWVTLNKADVGLGNVENLAPADLPLSDADASALAGKSDVTRARRLVAGTAATLEAGDAGDVVHLHHASAKALTIPPESLVAFAANTQVDVVSSGGGTLSFVAGSGVTLTGAADVAGDPGAVVLLYLGADAWLVVGAS